MTSDVLETERKYEAGPEFTVPGLAGIPGVSATTAPQVHRLTAIYCDTPDLRLATAKMTLRRREGGTDAGWHLKLPAGADTRREIHAPLTEGLAVPAPLAAKVAPWVAGQPLVPVARLDTLRTVHEITDDHGQVLAEIADDQVTGALPGGPAAGGPWRQVVVWREVEVELKGGPRELLDLVGERLCAAGARPSAAPSKLSVVLAHRSGDARTGEPPST